MFSQVEADHLIFGVEKHRIDSTIFRAPTKGDAIEIPLRAPDTPQENFKLDINRKYRTVTLHVEPIFQLRTRSSCQLVRLEIDPHARRHCNPDGEWMNGPHVHVYVEGFDLDWAYPLDPTDLKSFWIAHPTAPKCDFPEWDLTNTETAWRVLLEWVKVVTPPFVNFPIF